jgi:opacity protein-like surface antigen
MYKKIVFILIAAIMVLSVIPDAYAKQGFYVGLGATYNTIEGDFNGSAGILQNGSEVINLPDIKNDFGIDVLGGYGITDQGAIELNFMNSWHRGRWSGQRGDVTYTSFSVNGKYSFLSSSMVQPYLLFGISGNSLLINHGSRNTTTGEVGDATLSGPGANFGAGIDAYLTPHVSVTLGTMYRYVDYTDASGVDHSGSIDGELNGSGFSFMLTTAYHF